MAILILLAIIVGGGAVLYVNHRLRYGRDESSYEAAIPLPAEGGEGRGGEAEETECCGQHAVCEKFGEPLGESPVYYEDEHLDRFAGRRAEAYTDSDVEEFRDVLYTLIPADRIGWGRSIEQRGIQMPQTIRDEYLMLLEEV